MSNSESTRSSPGSPRLRPPPGGVVIRMYRQGLGDCFLLAFAGESRSTPCYVLVDCGAHFAQPGGRETMARVIDDLIECTGGRIDIVVATHEHTDHLSAFKHSARRLLNGDLKIGQLWLAWTERDDDEIARQLRGERVNAKEAIEAAIERLKEGVKADEAPSLMLSARLAAATQFFAIDDREDDDTIPTLASRLGLADPEKVTGNELALALLKATAKEVRFLTPGNVSVPIPGSPTARAYVLGPPRDMSLLRKFDPSRGDRHETFLTSAIGLASFATAAVHTVDNDLAARERAEFCFPFDTRLRLNPFVETEADKLSPEQRKFFDQFYGSKDAWRRIDRDWLFAAGELALHLDRHTNNTSLALAFELGEPGEGPVLLFPADAQVGNWLSWQGLTWKLAGREIGIADLLRRTAVYKVGHHASHNATLARDETGAEYGLRLVQDGVVALIPVDQAAAEKLPGWEMPYENLYEFLKQKTRGNILRSDDADRDLPMPRIQWSDVPGVPRARWRRSQKQKSEKSGSGPLYYDLSITPES